MGDEMVVNGVTYVKKQQQGVLKDGMRYCIFRTYSAGVHAGYEGKSDGTKYTIHDSRRIYKWDGAMTLSEMSQFGVKNPDNCHFACVVPELDLTQVVEVIPCTDIGHKSIVEVKKWE